MAASPYRNRGLNVVVDTTRQAEFDFASHQLSPREQEVIGTNLKTVPHSPRDRFFGNIRVREVLKGWEVAFTIALDDNEVVILVIGVEVTGKFESHFEQIRRAGMAELPPGVQELLTKRRRRYE